MTPHVGGYSHDRATGALLLLLMFVLTSCTTSPDAEREPASSADLSTRITDHLERFDEYDKVRAVLVYENGESVLELYRVEGAEDYLNLRSVTKSVVSTLIGIAIDEGLIVGVDATLGELLPAYRDAMSAEVAAIPLESILTHTAGFAAGGSTSDAGELDYYSTPDWVGAIIADRVARGPGDGAFEYSNAGSHVLAAILDEATDGAVLDFARAHLFDPLGIDSQPAWVGMDGTTPEEREVVAQEYLAAGFAWPIDPQGIHSGESFLKLRPEHLAKLGQLYLDKGMWKGEPIVSPAWVEDATATHVDTFSTPNGYGYQWWTHTEGDESMFLALGYGGNLVAVVPERDLVVVVASTFEGVDPLENAQKFDIGEGMTLLQSVILAPAGPD